MLYTFTIINLLIENMVIANRHITRALLKYEWYIFLYLFSDKYNQNYPQILFVHTPLSTVR